MAKATEPGVPEQQAAPYPTELECGARTMNGSAFHLRPIRPDDGARLTEFHEHLSPQSIYRRYLFMHRTLSTTEVERFTHTDNVDRLALVAEYVDRLVAVGRYERLSGTAEAEVAFVVADEFQHLGIGTIRLEQLAAAALKHGIKAFVAQTLAENRDMIDVFMKSGFHVTSSREYGTVNVRFPIEPDDAYRSACADRHHAEYPLRGGLTPNRADRAPTYPEGVRRGRSC